MRLFSKYEDFPCVGVLIFDLVLCAFIALPLYLLGEAGRLIIVAFKLMGIEPMYVIGLSFGSAIAFFVTASHFHKRQLGRARARQKRAEASREQQKQAEASKG